MFTTLNQIRAKSPCAGGWKRLLASLNKTQSDDAPLSIVTIIDNNGIDDALWCLRAVEGNDKELSLYGVWCARQVQHLMTDKRSIDALDVAERFANGEATQEELNVARSAAWAAWDAASAAARVSARVAWTSTSAADTDYYAACCAAGAAGAAGAAACGADWSAYYAADHVSSVSMRNAQESRLREICQ